MSELNFEVIGSRPEPYHASPTLSLQQRITETTGARLHAIALRCQVQIEPRRRRYSRDEEERLLELFGAPRRWSETLQTIRVGAGAAAGAELHGANRGRSPVDLHLRLRGGIGQVSPGPRAHSRSARGAASSEGSVDGRARHLAYGASPLSRGKPQRRRDLL
jgi:hypothetical protein